MKSFEDDQNKSLIFFNQAIVLGVFLNVKNFDNSWMVAQLFRQHFSHQFSNSTTIDVDGFDGYFFICFPIETRIDQSVLALTQQRSRRIDFVEVTQVVARNTVVKGSMTNTASDRLPLVHRFANRLTLLFAFANVPNARNWSNGEFMRRVVFFNCQTCNPTDL